MLPSSSARSEGSKQGTWKQALLSFFTATLAVLTFRWIVFEPYVIPSGSMIPTLLELDYIYVNKFSYGIRLPFSSSWIWERSGPKRCDVVVFRSQTEPGQFLVKRVMGLPGEKIELFSNGTLAVDGVPLKTSTRSSDVSHSASSDGFSDGSDDGTQVLSEDCGNGRSHDIRVTNHPESAEVEYSVVVPENHYVMFGDNRHQSSDSRVWGALPRQELLGQALGIWLSCDESLEGLSRVCNPATIRWARIFKGLETEKGTIP